MLTNWDKKYQAMYEVSCSDIKFEDKLQKEDLEKLQLFLKHPKHKIVALNMASEQFKQKEINKVLKVLSDPHIDNSRIDVIDFGQRKIYEKDLIVMGKWMLNKFSANEYDEENI